MIEFLDDPAFEEDEELEEEEVDEDNEEVNTGLVCAVCGARFTEPHGKPVVCESCADTSEGSNFPLATHPEDTGSVGV